MADATKTEVRRTSKRKRAQVKYYEEAVSDDDSDFIVEEVEEEVRVSRAKKRKAASSKPLPKKKIFPFLELPAEIRNEIYSHCLHDPAGIYLFSTTQKFRRTVYRGSELKFRGRPATPHPPPSGDSDDEDEASQQDQPNQPSSDVQPLVPALLSVCKQVNREARDILYGHEFYVEDTLALHSFLVDIGARAARYLKNITLGDWGFGRGVHKAYNHACFTALSSATNLEHFTYHGILSWREAPKSVATIFYRDAFPWLEAVGVAKGKADAALDMISIMTEIRGGSGYNWYWRRGHRGQPRPSFKEYDKMDGFRAELGKLLNARMDRIRS
ncbi:hypothetical protein SLS60_003691 [Paraconiothyrium brasiliense]|uniref:2EXR domain-containing protein n=1 Tax=Paraconiothyrium brasiliense TaxID=300254 RepID=A0ABR3RPC9_9PLEO